MVNRGFAVYRVVGHRLVAGWLAQEVLTILAVLDSAQRSRDVSGAVAEIGVHHGRLFIALNLLQLQGEHSVAVDVFGDQKLNVDQSGRGDLAAFHKNIKRWSLGNGVVVHQGDSTQLNASSARDLAHGDIRLFSVDGGHTEETVFSDMKLAEATVCSGGIVIADDVFNEQWPDVSTGTLRYLDQGGGLTPFAVGFNKVFFAMPEYADYYRDVLLEHFEKKYLVYVKMAQYLSHDVLVIFRVPWRPRALAGRSKTAKNIYRRIHEMRR